jgi:hypothetical protein
LCSPGHQPEGSSGEPSTAAAIRWLTRAKLGVPGDRVRWWYQRARDVASSAGGRRGGAGGAAERAASRCWTSGTADADRCARQPTRERSPITVTRGVSGVHQHATAIRDRGCGRLRCRTPLAAGKSRRPVSVRGAFFHKAYWRAVEGPTPARSS